MKCPKCGSDMIEEKGHSNVPGLSIIEDRGKCPKCGATHSLDTTACFIN